MRTLIFAMALAAAGAAETGPDIAGAGGSRGAAAHEAGHVFRDCAECPEMVVVPAGGFVMGALSPEEGRSGHEGAAHPARMREPFAAGVYEVTCGEFSRFAPERGR